MKGPICFVSLRSYEILKVENVVAVVRSSSSVVERKASMDFFLEISSRITWSFLDGHLGPSYSSIRADPELKMSVIALGFLFWGPLIMDPSKKWLNLGAPMTDMNVLFKTYFFSSLSFNPTAMHVLFYCWEVVPTKMMIVKFNTE